MLISPCRDEADLLRYTLESVIAQTLQPTLWVIVDDGSTDATPELLEQYTEAHPWIRIVRRENRGHRAVGPGVIDAFYAGYETIDPDDFEYICKLDLDLDLPPRYFETLIQRMEADPTIGTCSGKAWLRNPDGTLEYERHGDDTSLGMTKLYRTRAFQDIGGFVREVMWDGIDCHRCRMLGWQALSWSDPELRFIHLRPMGSSQRGILTGRRRHGFGQHFMGTGFIYMLASCLLRMNQKPYVIGSLSTLYGWIHARLTGKPVYPDPAFRNFLRDYQWRVLLQGKRRALRHRSQAPGTAADR